MRPLASVSTALAAALFWSPRVQAEDFDRACGTELGIFCNESGSAGTLMRCLDGHRADLRPHCAEALDAALEDAREQAKSGGKTAPARELEVRLTRVEGSVFVHTSAQKEGEFVPAAEGMPLEPGDLIRTGSDGMAEVGIDGRSAVAVLADSDLRLDDLDSRNTEVRLGLGSLLAKIAHLDRGAQMRFVTESAVAAVRGTELAVSQEEPGLPTKVAVFDEGKVTVNAEGAQGAVTLMPGQETEVKIGRPPAPAKPLTVLAGMRKDMEETRRRCDALRGRWKPRAPEERRTMRAQMTQKPAMPGSKLPKVRPSQKGMTYRALPRPPRKKPQPKQ